MTRIMLDIEGIEATLDNHQWETDDDTLLSLLNAYLDEPVVSREAEPDQDLALAIRVAKDLEASILKIEFERKPAISKKEFHSWLNSQFSSEAYFASGANYQAQVGEVIVGSLGRGTGGKFTALKDLPREMQVSSILQKVKEAKIDLNPNSREEKLRKLVKQTLELGITGDEIRKAINGTQKEKVTQKENALPKKLGKKSSSSSNSKLLQLSDKRANLVRGLDRADSGTQAQIYAKLRELNQKENELLQTDRGHIQKIKTLSQKDHSSLEKIKEDNQSSSQAVTWTFNEEDKRF